jgi:hypothetical protein
MFFEGSAAKKRKIVPCLESALSHPEEVDIPATNQIAVNAVRNEMDGLRHGTRAAHIFTTTHCVSHKGRTGSALPTKNSSKACFTPGAVICP